MAFKITQCLIPFFHHNRQIFIQVLNTFITNNTNKSFSTKLANNEDGSFETNIETAEYLLKKKLSTNSTQNVDLCKKEADPCKKVADPCKKVADPCKKEADLCKKEADPCKQKTDPCKKEADQCENKIENLAAVLHGMKDLRMETKPVPTIKSNQVLLQLEVCGICGTDVHFYEKGKLGSWAVTQPMIIGHEASGTVVKCGECVKSLKEGDKIAIEPQVACRKCALCKAGNYHMCSELRFCAAPPHDGNLCRFFAHDEDYCHKLPCNLDFEMGTLIEPLAVGVHGCKKGNVTSGDSVLVIGAGPVGLASLLTAKAYGAAQTIVLDVDDFKCKKAMELGADCAMNVKGVPEAEVVKKIRELSCELPNKTLECSGFQEAIRIGILATRTCGQMVLLGLGQDNQCLPIMDTVYREIDVIGAIRYANDYPTAINMVHNCKFDPKPLITHHFKLEDAPKAYEMAAKREEEYIKIFIHANPNWKPPEKKC